VDGCLQPTTKPPLVSIEISDEWNFYYSPQIIPIIRIPQIFDGPSPMSMEKAYHGYLSSALRHTAILDTRFAVATVFIMPSSLSLPTQYAVCAWHFSNAWLDLSDCPALACIELSYHQSALYYCHHHQLPLTHHPPPHLP